jgi:hypothetical protein
MDLHEAELIHVSTIKLQYICPSTHLRTCLKNSVFQYFLRTIKCKYLSSSVPGSPVDHDAVQQFVERVLLGQVSIISFSVVRIRPRGKLFQQVGGQAKGRVV